MHVVNISFLLIRWGVFKIKKKKKIRLVGLFFHIPRTGLEPARLTALGSKPSMSTNSITSAKC